MGSSRHGLGLKAHRKQFDATGKLAVSCHLAGEEARLVMEFMEAEEIENPGAAGRVLIQAALSAYPEWTAGIHMRRAVVTEQRMWAMRKLADLLQEMAAETEANLEEARLKMESDLIDAATARQLEGDGT